MELLNIYDLADKLKGHKVSYAGFGLLFCFGTSLVSKIIQAKTRVEDGEIVPSHVAIIYGQFVFESTTDIVNINDKIVKSGVRMWLLTDFIEAEKNRLTKYYFYEMNQGKIDKDTLCNCLHLPYGRDTIIDFLLKDKSEGTSTKGLICSQYANKATKLSKQRCPSPADLFRIVKDLKNGTN